MKFLSTGMPSLLELERTNLLVGETSVGEARLDLVAGFLGELHPFLTEVSSGFVLEELTNIVESCSSHDCLLTNPFPNGRDMKGHKGPVVLTEE